MSVSSPMLHAWPVPARRIQASSFMLATSLVSVSGFFMGLLLGWIVWG